MDEKVIKLIIDNLTKKNSIKTLEWIKELVQNAIELVKLKIEEIEIRKNMSR